MKTDDRLPIKLDLQYKPILWSIYCVCPWNNASKEEYALFNTTCFAVCRNILFFLFLKYLKKL